jgi:hypothetical protein
VWLGVAVLLVGFAGGFRRSELVAIDIGPDAAMRLAISRAVAVETSRGWRIAKEKQSHKIDVVVALAMSALAAVRSQGAGSYLPYELWVSHDADEVVDVPPPPKRLCPTLSDADFMRITQPPALYPSEAGR